MNKNVRVFYWKKYIKETSQRAKKIIKRLKCTEAIKNESKGQNRLIEKCKSCAFINLKRIWGHILRVSVKFKWIKHFKLIQERNRNQKIFFRNIYVNSRS
jgi:hypothetical protein